MLSKIAQRSLSSSAACSAGRIKVANPVVEMDGDEMTRIIWQKVLFYSIESIPYLYIITVIVIDSWTNDSPILWCRFEVLRFGDGIQRSNWRPSKLTVNKIGVLQAPHRICTVRLKKVWKFGEIYLYQLMYPDRYSKFFYSKHHINGVEKSKVFQSYFLENSEKFLNSTIFSKSSETKRKFVQVAENWKMHLFFLENVTKFRKFSEFAFRIRFSEFVFRNFFRVLITNIKFALIFPLLQV